MERQDKASTKQRIFGLQARMTISYLVMAVLYALLLESLVIIAFFLVVPHLPGASHIQQGRLPSFLNILQGIAITGLFWLVVVAPVGALFGALFTRGLIRRIRQLGKATASFAEGDYSQRVPITKRDEIGLLEERFNQMAQQLVESMKKEQKLIEENTRAEERARIEQEIQTARLIQHSLLPRELPDLNGWQLATYYQPAREVGGDLYDFLTFADGRLGLVIGDATDKGVPAAMMMATTRSMLRAAVQASDSPGEVLERVNDLLYADTPERIFVTCFYAILEPESGKLRYANAGHDLPYRWHEGKVAELRATGMPLGLMPGMHYEEKETILAHGESLLFYSDGLVEAHNPGRDMFGFPRLIALLGAYEGESTALDYLRAKLAAFTGDDWEQEDDITLVMLQRAPVQLDAETDPWRVLATYLIPSAVGNERLAMDYVAETVSAFSVPERRLEQLGTAVAEATMNAMEHGNQYNPEISVTLQVLSSDHALAVRISDQGGDRERPALEEYEAPDLEAKLAELQSPRGWGLFLIQNMVDEMHVHSDAQTHTVELILHLAEDLPAQ